MYQNQDGNKLIIQASEGYTLTFRGDSSNQTFAKIILPVNNTKMINKIIEVEDTNIPIYVPEYQKDTSSMNVDELQQFIISQTKIILQEFLSDNPIEFNGKKYNVTSETQSHLASVIKAAEDAQELEISYTPMWNAIDEQREGYELVALKQLFIEIQKYVLIFVMQQQKMEREILQISDREKLLNYSIKYIKED